MWYINKTMKIRIVLAVILTVILGLFSAAAYADSQFFALEPTDSGKTWEGANPYARNIFWDFSTNPASTTDQAYYGTWDNDLVKGPLVKAGDSVAFSNSDVKFFGNKIEVESGKSGYATFNIGNLALSPNNFSKYFWLEMDVDLKRQGTVAVTLTGTGASVIDSWANQGAGQSGNTWTWSFGDNSGLTKTVNAWFKLDPFASAESLKIDFVGGSHSSAHAYIDNLHIATTPEPISAALFITGAAIMALKKRRKLQLASAA